MRYDGGSTGREGRDGRVLPGDDVFWPRPGLNLRQLGARRQQRCLSLQQLGRQDALIQQRQRVASADDAPDVDGNIHDHALPARHDVDLARRLHGAGVAEHAADGADADRDSADNEPAGSRTLLGSSCFGSS